jgi:thiol-disulfide isomerase/thioredoxin
MLKRSSLLMVVLTLLLSSCSSGNEDNSSEPAEIAVQPSEEPTTQSETEDEISNTSPSKKPKKKSMPVAAAESAQPGSYLTLAEYENSKDRFVNSNVVLFFNANWCSTCKIARDNIEANLDSIPSNLAIVVVDFDKETDLRKKYGVTIQHTFVQIDKDGNQLTKWSGSVTAQEIAEETV